MDQYERIRNELENQVEEQNAQAEQLKELFLVSDRNPLPDSYNHTLIRYVTSIIMMQSRTNELVGQLITILDSRIED